MRSGTINVSNADKLDALRGVAPSGSFWSRSAAVWGVVLNGTGTASMAYSTGFSVATGASVYPSSCPSFRCYSFPLRCLSTAVEGEESGS